jgi:hypothetical protein
VVHSLLVLVVLLVKPPVLGKTLALRESNRARLDQHEELVLATLFKASTTRDLELEPAAFPLLTHQLASALGGNPRAVQLEELDKNRLDRHDERSQHL